MRIIKWLWPDGIIGSWFQPKQAAVGLFVVMLIVLPIIIGLFMVH